MAVEATGFAGALNGRLTLGVIPTVLPAVAGITRGLLAAHPGVAGIGVGIGAQVDDEGVVLSSTLLTWREPVALAASLYDAMPRFPFRPPAELRGGAAVRHPVALRSVQPSSSVTRRACVAS